MSRPTMGGALSPGWPIKSLGSGWLRRLITTNSRPSDAVEINLGPIVISNLSEADCLSEADWKVFAGVKAANRITNAAARILVFFIEQRFTNCGGPFRLCVFASLRTLRLCAFK